MNMELAYNDEISEVFLGIAVASGFAQISTEGNISLDSPAFVGIRAAGMDPDGKLAAIKVDVNGHVICSTLTAEEIRKIEDGFRK
jgi:hypothetical protein